MPAPAPVCTSTWWPLWMSSRALEATRPTRYSWVLISLGTPISMMVSSIDRLQDLAQFIEHLVDVGLFPDQGRREGDDVAGDADEQAVLVGLHEGLEGALGDLAGARLQLDCGDEDAGAHCG